MKPAVGHMSQIQEKDQSEGMIRYDHPGGQDYKGATGLSKSNTWR